MKIVAYLNLCGKCREAFQYYREVLGGEIVDMVSYRDMGVETGNPEWSDKIMHACLRVGDQQLMGGDPLPDSAATPQGFSVSLHLDTDSESERIYNALVDGGTVLMPLARTEWSSHFGMLTDKYGTPWIINSTEGTPTS